MAKSSSSIKQNIYYITAIASGVIACIMGIRCILYNPDALLYTFGSDYYTESYKIAYLTHQATVSAVKGLGFLLFAFGVFEFSFFSIKYNDFKNTLNNGSTTSSGNNKEANTTKTSNNNKKSSNSTKTNNSKKAEVVE